MNGSQTASGSWEGPGGGDDAEDDDAEDDDDDGAWLELDMSAAESHSG